jgi:trans-aconitate 2-methyltransferase
MSQVVEFYDAFSKRQKAAGINNRHVSIQFHLQQAGLKEDDKILEVGCGIGTVSHLILKSLSKKGFLHAVDISPRSIEVARQFNAVFTNSKFEVLDLTKECIDARFNVIVLPDVLEHIPFELYPALFQNLNRMLIQDGLLFIHIPHPNYLQSLVDNKSTELQIIDHPVYTDKLLSLVYPQGFYLHSLKSYSVYTEQDDYQILILKKKLPFQTYTRSASPFQLSLRIRILQKLSNLVRIFK